MLRNRTDLTDVLAELGASTDVSPADLAVAAVARGEQAELPAELDPDAQEVVILAVLRGVRDAVDPGFRGVVGGSPEGTLLHHAAWVAELLVGAGAELEPCFEEVAEGPLYDYVSGSSAAWRPATDVSP